MAGTTKQFRMTKFTAAWCQPCKAVKPIVKKLLANHPEIAFDEVDVDENEKEADEWKIKSMPTFVFTTLDGKKELARCYWEDLAGFEKVVAKAQGKLATKASTRK